MLSNCWCFQSWGISLAVHLIGTARVLTDEINIIRYIYHWWMKTFGETVHIFAGSVLSIEQNILGPMTSPYFVVMRQIFFWSRDDKTSFAWSAPSHYPTQCWNIVNSNLRNKLQWKIQFKKIHLKMSSAKWRLFRLGLNELNVGHVLHWHTSIHCECTYNCSKTSSHFHN